MKDPEINLDPKTHLGPKLHLDPEGEARRREVLLLVNVIMPDPDCQPFYLSDEATVFEIYNHRENIIQRRLSGYFGTPITGNIRQPIWKLVDDLRALFPGWPDGYE